LILTSPTSTGDFPDTLRQMGAQIASLSAWNDQENILCLFYYICWQMAK
jgi:hypothetical protein